MINIQKKIDELKQTVGGEALKARWKTEAQGAKDGAANYPPEDAFVISGTEQQVKADCEAQLNTGISLFRGEVTRLLDERNEIRQKIDQIQDETSIRIAQFSILPKKTQHIASVRTALMPVAEAHEAQYRHFKLFKSTNDLIGKVAHYPENKIQHFRLILIGFFIEVLLTSYFYAEASPYGPLGGILLALAFAFIGTIAAVIAGERFTFINHINPVQKFGYVGLSVLLMLLFGLVALVGAHMRMAINNLDLSNPNLIDVMKDATHAAGGKVFSSQFLNFSGDALSALLLVGAIVFGILAAWKGYTSDDEYPQYGKVDRRHEQVRGQYEEAKTRHQSELHALFKKVRDEISKILKDAKENVDGFERAITEQKELLNEMHTFTKQAQTNCNVAISSYRARNSYVANRPRPTYFSEELVLNTVGEDLVPTVPARDVDLLPNFKGHIQTLSTKIQAAFERISIEESDAIKEYAMLVQQIEMEVSIRINQHMPHVDVHDSVDNAA